MKKIVISLIHNNNEDRLAYIRPKIKSLMFELQNIVDVEYYEFFGDKYIGDINFISSIKRDWFYLKLNRDWNDYKKSKNRLLVFDFFIFIFKTFLRYFVKNKREKYLKFFKVECYITKNHILSLLNAQGQSADYLLVFEDDAIFKPDSINKLVDLINNNKRNNDNIPLYVDLAGGNNLDEIKVKRLEYKRDSFFRYYKKPITDTVCCYLINKKQIDIFCRFLDKFPKLSYIGIDWMFNKIFIMEERDNIKTLCFHSDPSFFEHGSFSKYKARDRF